MTHGVNAVRENDRYIFILKETTDTMDLETLFSNPKEAQILLAKYPMLLELLNTELHKKSIESVNDETVSAVSAIECDEGTNVSRELTIPLVVSELITEQQPKPKEIIPSSASAVEHIEKVAIPPDEQPTDEKYLQFQKWLNESATTAQVPPTLELTSIDTDDDDDEENDVFMDTNSRRSSTSDWTVDLSEPTGRRYRPNKGKAPLPPTTEPATTSLLLTVDAGHSSCRSSNSDLTVDSCSTSGNGGGGGRRRSNKGPAPSPPPQTAETNVATAKIDQNSIKQLKTIFTKYIPQMLMKPISPASSVRNVHMETDI